MEEYNEGFVLYFVAHPERTITQTKNLNREKLVIELHLWF
jgi:hypothetical protein